MNSVARSELFKKHACVTTTPPEFPHLETERLLLREITHNDIDAMFAIHGDPDLMKWFGQPVADREAARNLIDVFASWQQLPDPGVRWGLQRRDVPGLIGSCGLFGRRRNDRSCTLGYELAHGAQGQGYMTEALQLTIRWGFEQMDLHRIEARIHPNNLPSLQLAGRLGFTIEGLLRDVAHWSGQHHDLHVLSLLETDR